MEPGGARLGWGVGKDDMELALGQLLHQPRLRVLPDVERLRSVQRERRLHQAVGDGLGQAAHDADAQDRVRAVAPAARDLHELVARAEDVLRVARDLEAERRRHEPAAAPLEQLAPEELLEEAELRAERGVAQAELSGGARHASLARDNPEVEQVLVVQGFHGPVAPTDIPCRDFVISRRPRSLYMRPGVMDSESARSRHAVTRAGAGSAVTFACERGRPRGAPFFPWFIASRSADPEYGCGAYGSPSS